MPESAAIWRAAAVNRRPTLVRKRLAAAAFLKAAIVEWRERRRTRKLLSRMTERDFRDFGASSCDVEAETAKPFWIP